MTPARNERQNPGIDASKNPSPRRSPTARRNAPRTECWTSVHAAEIMRAALSCGGEEPLEKGLVDRRQPADVGNLDALVGLVHRLADETEFGDRAIGVDKARVGRAACRAELRRQAGDRADRR